MPYILMSQTSEYEATSQLALFRGKERRASFQLPHTSYEVSQSSHVVNEVSKPSRALTCLMSNLLHLALSYLVAISGYYSSSFLYSVPFRKHLTLEFSAIEYLRISIAILSIISHKLNTPFLSNILSVSVSVSVSVSNSTSSTISAPWLIQVQ